MSSATNDEMHPPPPQKPRISPLEFRNTDLVSRLLAATPPYLYNMPLVPHTYFFSEMLRSLVQAKTENRSGSHQGGLNAPQIVSQGQRRTRKRSWTNSLNYHQQKHVLPTQDTPVMKEGQMQPPLPPIASSNWGSGPGKMFLGTPYDKDKPLELTIRGKHDATSSGTISSENSDSMVLPPPPPLWYPPLYPPGSAPYSSTFDPLHFFIDLRVSGHIYDRKLGGEEKPKEDVGPPSGGPLGPLYFKQSRHCSAFSVPNSGVNVGPMNLTNAGGEVRKFDVKSMGFDIVEPDVKSNTISTNYIMQNIDGIYKGIGSSGESVKKDVDSSEDKAKEEDDEEKKAKDLRALIGLELVVDYMKQKKNYLNGQKNILCDSSENVPCRSTSRSGSSSPADLEVVALSENERVVAFNN